MTNFEIHPIRPGLTRIVLAAPESLPQALAEPVNVYLVEEGPPALINAGHPLQAEALAQALRACHVTPAQIERIIVTSWEIGVLGAATQFPRADLFVLSPDMRAPRDYEMHIDSLRQHLLGLTAEMAAADPNFRRQPVEAALSIYYPRMTRNLRFIPLRNGHFVCAGSLHLEVLETAGPGPGHMSLYAEKESLLFCGDFALSGLPRRLENTQAYLISLERMAELPVDEVLPNFGRPFTRGQWTLVRAARFLNNFLTSASTALVQEPTIPGFIERDLGVTVEEPVEFLLHFEVFRTLFEELVRARAIIAAGQGIRREYGVDIDDPRAEIR